MDMHYEWDTVQPSILFLSLFLFIFLTWNVERELRWRLNLLQRATPRWSLVLVSDSLCFICERCDFKYEKIFFCIGHSL